MTSERWKRLEGLYHAARDQPPAERSAFLADACRDDEALRQDIESLLDQNSTNGFLSKPALPDAPRASDFAPSPMVGRTIGGYLIQALLGVGGMGEVYRARDGKLGRDVAIKLLPPLLASDPDRMARFEREARLLATLNHHNICAIYGLEASDGVRFLVLELVEGQTLAERLQGPPRAALSVPEALAIARQIIDALEAAHEQGIVHRDLKPANIKVREDGTVKVLDFGLAKMLDPVRADGTGQWTGPAANASMSPTITTPAMTEAGMILGTASYMAPEQARGKTVDKRADVWAFGVVLYEMLTGTRLFGGDETSDVLAAILKTEPDWSALPANMPSGLRRLLAWCLEKDPKRRLRDIGDARLLLNDTAAPVAAGASAQSKFSIAAWGAAAVFLLAGATLALVHFREAPPTPERSVRFDVPPPEKSTVTSFALSPDGRFLALVAIEGGRTGLWIRPLDSLNAQVLPGTEGAQGTPFWSPESTAIGFFAEGRLKSVSVAGGPPETLSEGAPSGFAGTGTWNRDGVIVFGGRVGSPLQRVSAGKAPLAVGGTPSAGERYSFPHFLPDGRRFLYTSTGAKPEVTGIFLGSLDGAPPVRILPDPSPAIYVPAASAGAIGYLLFRREDTLMARAFDLGNPGKVAELVSLASPARNFAASETGHLAHQATITGVQLAWVDRSGKRLESVGPAGTYTAFRLAPDDKAIIFDRPDASTSVPDIWKFDLVRGAPTRLTTDPNVDNLPIWSFDGSHVVFGSVRNGGGKFDLYLKAATGVGQEELLVKMGTLSGYATDWSRNGDIVYEKPGPNTGTDLWIAPQGGDRKPFPYLQEPYNEQDGLFSPDGQWVAYVSDESGRKEVYVQAFPRPAEKVPISTGGGSDPAWRRDGTELFYLAADRKLVAVPFKVGRGPGGPTFEPGVPESLFSVPGNLTSRSYAAAADGRRFLVSMPTGDASASSITVVLNWAATMKRQ
jgi:Tol biopolymer transport system component